MRAPIVLLTTSASLAIVAACASTEGDTALAPEPALDSGASDTSAPDAAAPDVDVPDTRIPDCSSAGWCVTSLPSADLDLRDIWPLEDSAFALAESYVDGVKFLEWKKSTNAWEFIDDLSQNGAGSGTFAGGVYAPSADEVYFAVGGSFIYRGTRAEAKWTWTRTKLPDNITSHPTTHDHGYFNDGVAQEGRAALGVWGASASAVYAYYSNTIFRRDPGDGSWSTVYTVDELDADDEHAFFVAASGTGPDDVWFAGARDRGMGSCPLLVRKTADGWERIADGTVTSDFFNPCEERAGTLRIGAGLGGWLTDIRPVSATEYVGLHHVFDMFEGTTKAYLTRIRASESESAVEQTLIPVQLAQSARRGILSSLWRGDGETWFTAWGLVLRGADGAPPFVSSISRDGAPVDAPLRKIRGTSNQNLWAIGARHAYHKTNP